VKHGARVVGSCALLVALTLPLAGCIKSKTLVVVNPDGSGNIAVRNLMSPEAASMMGSAADGFATALGATGQVAKTQDPFFKEDELRAAAAKFGEGVTYVKGTKVNENNWQGSSAVYAFADINKIRIPLDNKSDGGGGMPAEEPAAEGAKPEKFITFNLSGGSTKTLRILVPQEEDKPAADAAPAKAPAEPQAEAFGEAMGQAMMAPMLQMMKGMEMGVAVQVKGKVLKNNALHPEEDGNRIVVMEVNMDKMQTATNFAAIFQKSQGKDMPKRDLLGMPGFRFETNTAVEVQFK
jgi:hypothetical protein